MEKKPLETIHPPSWDDYELIDCGSGRKLERFGAYITIRPEPHAKRSPELSSKRWQEMAHAEFAESGGTSGKWKLHKAMPDEWLLNYPLGDRQINFNLKPTRFKHLGVFPEQSVNWEYIYSKLSAIRGEKHFLNVFAYTGGASLAAKAAGADVVHVDAVKQVVTWARKNMESSALEGIRWTVEDAMKFVLREVRRGRKYHGLILDPPAFGNGPKGENWVLDEQIEALMEAAFRLVMPEVGFLILNTYSTGVSAALVSKLALKHSQNAGLHGEHQLALLKGVSKYGNPLSHGLLYRFQAEEVLKTTS